MTPTPGSAISYSQRDRPGLSPATAEVSSALVLRYFDMWNTGQGATADELLGPNYIDHAHPDFLGPAALRSLVPRLHAMFPGVVVRAEIVASDAEYIAVRTKIEPADAGGYPQGRGNGVALFGGAEGKLAGQGSGYEP